MERALDGYGNIYSEALPTQEEREVKLTFEACCRARVATPSTLVRAIDAFQARAIESPSLKAPQAVTRVRVIPVTARQAS